MTLTQTHEGLPVPDGYAVLGYEVDELPDGFEATVVARNRRINAENRAVTALLTPSLPIITLCSDSIEKQRKNGAFR